MMRLGYFADGPWSHRTFELLTSDPSIEVAFVVPRLDTKDSFLESHAKEFGIDYLPGTKVNSTEFLAEAHAYGCDLFVSMSFNQIFNAEILGVPKYGVINCHAGKLPFYRGRNILNWALINDEEEFGITVHFVDQGIDTGDIILQKSYPITDTDDYGSLLETSYRECPIILHEAIKQIERGDYTRTKQSDIHPTGLYCGRRREGDEIIEWASTSREIFNFIRALSSPGPIARTILEGEPVKIGAARYIEDAPSYIDTPGQVLAKTEEGFLVKTSDSFLEILDIDSDARVKVGQRLGKE